MNKKYLTNKELYKEIIISKAMGQLTPKAKEYLYLIVKKMSKKFSYSNPDDRHDCEGEAIIHLLKNWYSFDELKTNNAFAYYSEICKRGFASGYNRLYKKDYLTGKYYNPISFSRLFEEGKSINI